MTEIALQRVDRRTLAEDGSCRFAFGYVSPLRTGAMAADEAYRRRVEARVLQGQAQSDLHRLRLRKRGVVAVRVRGKADDLGVDVRSAGKRVLALLEDQRGRAFADYLGLADEVGDLSPGKSADFVLVRPPAGSTLAAVLDQSESVEDQLAAVFTLAREESIAEVRMAGEVVWP